jgi:hypothetical protein
MTLHQRPKNCKPSAAADSETPLTNPKQNCSSADIERAVTDELVELRFDDPDLHKVAFALALLVTDNDLDEDSVKARFLAACQKKSNGNRQYFACIDAEAKWQEAMAEARPRSFSGPAARSIRTKSKAKDGGEDGDGDAKIPFLLTGGVS